MDIVIYDSAAIAPRELARVLSAEGHRVRVEPMSSEAACDLAVLDAAAWSDDATERLARSQPHTELLFLVDGIDAKLPQPAAMALVKPVDANKLVRLVRVIDQARSGVGDPRDLVDFETLFAGDSPAILELLRKVGLVARSDAPVWLHGELGSGRAVVARAIHDRSARRERPFMAVNAAAFPGDLLEEHLFGGAAPRAALADGGTLFVDGVTELAPGVQAKLLRLLDERLLRLRDTDHAIDVRVMVGDERRTMNVGGRLRRELYHRLRVHEIDLPALRERATDLGAIIARMLTRLRGGAVPLSRDALRMLESYPFPGNVRELAQALVHAVVLADGGGIDAEHLPRDIQDSARAEPIDDPITGALEALDAVTRRFERAYLLRVLRAVGGNRTRAAKILGLSRKGLWQKLKAHGIDPGAGRDADPEDDREIDGA